MSWIYAGTDEMRYELYAEMEKRYGHGHELKTLERKFTASSKCIGFCLYDRHPGFVTTTIMQAHHCWERDCLYFLEKPKKLRCFPANLRTKRLERRDRFEH